MKKVEKFNEFKNNNFIDDLINLIEEKYSHMSNILDVSNKKEYVNIVNFGQSALNKLSNKYDNILWHPAINKLTNLNLDFTKTPLSERKSIFKNWLIENGYL
jgi:uncharacterized protein YaaN involved in tellurite resistance